MNHHLLGCAVINVFNCVRFICPAQEKDLKSKTSKGNFIKQKPLCLCLPGRLPSVLLLHDTPLHPKGKSTHKKLACKVNWKQTQATKRRASGRRQCTPRRNSHHAKSWWKLTKTHGKSWMLNIALFPFSGLKQRVAQRAIFNKRLQRHTSRSQLEQDMNE